MQTQPFTPIIGRTASGATVWYTGKAGQAFISENPADAFRYETVEGARRKARILTNGLPLHGIYFVACVGDLKQEVAR